MGGVGQGRWKLCTPIPVMDVVRLAGRQDEAEGPAVSVASGMELGGEATARSAKPLVLLIPLFSPTAQ